MKNLKKMQRFETAREFLSDHPALNKNAGEFFYFFTWWVQQQCRNGECNCDRKPKDVTVSFFRGSKEFDKYVDEYGDKDILHDSEFPEFDKVEVPYKVVYGCEWELYEYVYAGEFSIFKFDEKRGTNKKGFHDWKDFNAYQGEFAKAKNFESMIIELAEKAKKNYGDFRYHDFYTKEESENHKNNMPWLSKEIKHNGRKAYQMLDNPDWIDVTYATLNLRWWDWYRTTEHYKRCWDGE